MLGLCILFYGWLVSVGGRILPDTLSIKLQHLSNLNQLIHSCQDNQFFQKLLSVITICKNNAHGLSFTISSLEKLRKSSPAIEFIFIDGKSSDGSLEIAEASGLFTKIVSEEDSGIYHAMNKGVAAASAKYIMFCNSGDMINANGVRDLLSKAQADSFNDFIVYHGDIQLFNNITQQVGVRCTIKNNFMACNIFRIKAFHPACMFPLEIFRDHRYDERNKVCSDLIHMYQVASSGYKFIQVYTLVACHDTGGISSNAYLSLSECITSFKSLRLARLEILFNLLPVLIILYLKSRISLPNSCRLLKSVFK